MKNNLHVCAYAFTYYNSINKRIMLLLCFTNVHFIHVKVDVILFEHQNRLVDDIDYLHNAN